MGYSLFGYAPQLFRMKGFPAIGTTGRNVLDRIGAKYGKTAYQVALNWLLRQEDLVAIPKALNHVHIAHNLQALNWELKQEEVKLIENSFPVKKS